MPRERRSMPGGNCTKINICPGTYINEATCLSPAAQNTIDCIDPERQQCIISEAVTPFCAFSGERGEGSVGRERPEGPRPLHIWPNKRTRTRSFWGRAGTHAVAITMQQSNKGGSAAEDERTRTAGGIFRKVERETSQCER